MFGIPITEPTKTYCDNESVVKNATIVTSTLAKKHNSIAYHKVRECMAQKSIEIHLIWSKGNIADFLTKFLLTHSTTCVSMPLFGVKGHNMTHIRPLRGLFKIGHTTGNE